MKSFDELKSLIEQRGVHAVFGAPGEGWAIEQNADELAQFLVVCQGQGVTSCLEIGTGYRAGLARFLHDDMGWQVTSVDIHDYGHQFDGIQFLNSDGVELPVFDQQFDLVMIDADHSYEGVKFDHDYYGKYAAKIIAFHDILGLRDCEGVRDYWVELCASDPGGLVMSSQGINTLVKPGYHEIIADGDQCGGIGYIVLSEVQAESERVTWDWGDGVIQSAARGENVEHTYQSSETVTVTVKPEKKPAPAKKTPAKKPTARKTTTKK